MIHSHRTALLNTALATLMIAPLAAFADVYKCTMASGLVTYQDVPCTNARAEEKLPLAPLPTSAEELAAARESAAALRQQDKELAERLQRDAESRRELAAVTPPPTYSAPAPVEEYRDSDRTVLLPYQPVGGVWRDGVYYPNGVPTYPLVRGDDYYGRPRHDHDYRPPSGPNRPPSHHRQQHSKLGHSSDEPGN
jgi:hypothetical protein